MLTIGSLFSGIGGLELGLEWAGLGPTLWQCEVDPFCRAVLAKHWPEARRFEDVTSPRVYPDVDLLCGGFPCQDVSSAGSGRGLGGARSGLWWHFARVVRQIRPRFVVVENVASGASRWVPAVREAFRALGYRTRALGVAASEVGALHRRRRIFVVAYAPRKRRQARLVSCQQAHGRTASDAVIACSDLRVASDPNGNRQHAFTFDAEVAGASSVAADALRAGLRVEPGRGLGTDRTRTEVAAWARGSFAEPPVVRVVHGLPRGLDGARRRSLGNCVVPQCAQVVGEVIQEML
jgi:DNA (cytosine-5)-methyltransferase 1